MVLPLLPLFAAGAATGLGTSLVKDWMTKKEAASAGSATYAPSSQDVYHAPYESYTPQQMYAPQVGYSYVGSSYQIHSPGATTKKQAALAQSSKPDQRGEWDMPQEYKFTPDYSSQTKSTDYTTLAIIAAVGIIGYGLVAKK